MKGFQGGIALPKGHRPEWYVPMKLCVPAGGISLIQTVVGIMCYGHNEVSKIQQWSKHHQIILYFMHKGIQYYYLVDFRDLTILPHYYRRGGAEA